MCREFGKQLRDLTGTYGLTASKLQNGHTLLEHPSLGVRVRCSSTPSAQGAIHAVERDIIRAFRNAGYAPDGTKLRLSNDNGSPKTYGNPYPALKTTNQDRSYRRFEFLEAALEGRSPRFKPAGRPGSFTDFAHIERNL